MSYPTAVSLLPPYRSIPTLPYLSSTTILPPEIIYTRAQTSHTCHVSRQISNWSDHMTLVILLVISYSRAQSCILIGSRLQRSRSTDFRHGLLSILSKCSNLIGSLNLADFWLDNYYVITTLHGLYKRQKMLLWHSNLGVQDYCTNWTNYKTLCYTYYC